MRLLEEIIDYQKFQKSIEIETKLIYDIPLTSDEKSYYRKLINEI